MNQNPFSPRPAMPLPPGTPNSGGLTTWIGLQSSNRWDAPLQDSSRVQIGDAMRAAKLWKVSVFGRHVLVDLAWGPNAKRTLRAIDPPLVVYVPGQVTVEAYPSGEEAAEVVCMIAPADAAGVATCRRFVAGPADLSVDAACFVALTASTLLVGGFGPYAVAAGERIPLRSGSLLQAGGAGFEEYEI